MTYQRKVRFDKKELPHNPKQRSTSGDRPPRSPFPRTGADEWALKSILSIDGGGVRSYSSRVTLQGLIDGYRALVILRALMDLVGKVEQAYHSQHATSGPCSSARGSLDEEECAATADPEATPVIQYSPCHYFDYIAGAGTGGIIAIFLGRYRMSVGEAIERYRDMCNDITVIVGRRLRNEKSFFSGNDKASKCLNAHFENLVPAWPSHDEDKKHLRSDPQRCRTIVCGCGSTLTALRSDAISSPPRSISDVALRCLGAGLSRDSYCDATHFYGNPSRTVLTEVSSTLRKEAAVLKDKLPSPEARSYDDDGGMVDASIDLLSIGTAVHNPPTPREPVKPRAQYLQSRMAKQVQTVHKELSAQTLRFDADRHGLRHYCRLDVPPPPSDSGPSDTVGVEEWKKGPQSSVRSALDRVDGAIDAFLRNDKDTARQLRNLATRLVRKRRRRAETVQWERWAPGTSTVPRTSGADVGNEEGFFYPTASGRAVGQRERFYFAATHLF